MKISFDYFDIERERGREWAENLPENLKAASDFFNIIFAVTRRGVWYSEAGHCWEYGGTAEDVKNYLQELADSVPYWEIDDDPVTVYN